MLTLEQLEAIEEAKPDCAACEGTGYGRWARVLHMLWYDFQFPVALRLLRESPRRIPVALDDFAREIIEGGKGWCYQLDQGDVDALVDKDRLWYFTRIPRTDEQRANCYPGGWTREPTGYRPTAEEVNWAASMHMVNPDDATRTICAEHRLARWDMGDTCGECRGTGKIGGKTWREMQEEAGDGN